MSGCSDGFDPPVWSLPALIPLSWLYKAGLAAYLAPYRMGIRKRRRLPCRVVSVGNLTFGGTGKSPTVRAICAELMKRGLRPAVISRGHGGNMCLEGGLVSDGAKRFMEPADCGDEPALLADALAGVPVAIGKDRMKSGKLLIERFDPDVLVLDDGMQYWQLARDVEIALVSAVAPFGSGRVLPAGDLREPRAGLARADVVVVTGAEEVSAERVDEVVREISRRASKAEVFVARREACAVVDAETGERMPVASLKGMNVVAVSGIARPDSFEKMLEGCGAVINARVRFGDHCGYTSAQVEVVESAASGAKAEAVVVTAKDAVKLRLRSRMLVLDMEMIVQNVEGLMRAVVGPGLEVKVGPTKS